MIEFKFTGLMNRAALQQALAYDYFYKQTQSLAETAVQTYIFCARTPRPAFLQRFGYAEAEQPGVYRSANPMLQPV